MNLGLEGGRVTSGTPRPQRRGQTDEFRVMGFSQVLLVRAGNKRLEIKSNPCIHIIKMAICILLLFISLFDVIMTYKI